MPIPAAGIRLSLPLRRRDALARTSGLSLLLHALLLLLALLSVPHHLPRPQGAGPISVEIMPDVGTAGGQKQSAPSFAPSVVVPQAGLPSEPAPPASAPLPAAPTAAVPEALLPVPPAPVPVPTPAVPPTPASPQAIVQPVPAPAPTAEVVPAPAPVTPPAPAPAQTAEAVPTPPPVAPPTPALPSEAALPPAAPAPATPPEEAARPPPLPALPPPAPAIAPTRPAAPLPRTAERPPLPPPPRRAPQTAMMIPFAPGRLFLSPPAHNAPNHTNRSSGPLDLSLGPAALNSLGAPPRTSRGMDASIRVEGAQVGDDWIMQLHEWWERHKYYPLDAARNDEEGEVQLHLVIRRDGVVESLELVHGSGYPRIDMAGESVFRNAHLQPFPFSTPEPKANVYLDLYFIIIRG